MWLQVSEVTALLESASREGPRAMAMLELLYATGMRVSELVSLNVEDVDLEQGSVRCFGKGSKERIIPIHRGAADLISIYLGNGHGQRTRPRFEKALFLSIRGRRMTRQGFWLALKRTAINAGISKRVTPHMIRHSFATHLLRGGAPLRYVQEMLGHASISTTQVYTHLNNEHMLIEFDRSHPRAGLSNPLTSPEPVSTQW